MSKPKNTQENIDSPSNQPKGSTPEIFLPLGNLRLKTNFSNSTQSPGMKKQEAEEDDEVERSYSPSKYFGKRPSFEFKNLKNIEKPLLNRQYSEFKFKEHKLDLSQKVSIDNSKKIRFKGTEEIIEDEMLDSKSFEKKTASKPILKKAHFTDEIPLEDIFSEEFNQTLIIQILEESKQNNKHYNELMSKYFVAFWKSVETDDEKAIRFLKVFNRDL